jgi:hypothetical protein
VSCRCAHRAFRDRRDFLGGARLITEIVEPNAYSAESACRLSAMSKVASLRLPAQISSRPADGLIRAVFRTNEERCTVISIVGFGVEAESSYCAGIRLP